ncbi:MAG: NUDIX domain-containing protein [Chloroflexi bacterium]|nr:NUDIX domain-containing protein [Chloroflexota bacterium]MDA1271479.1 NUDIX domain-containing protein [Chloroflexota bacterium]PKB58613.1 MAG: hypothetical protein BZY83_06040 [SAR202 cluster bacterium Casp-Chloro-G2]
MRAGRKKINQAGAVAFRPTPNGPEFLLVTSNDAARSWIFPKGHIEPGETPVQAAVRELAEEAGVTAAPLGSLGVLEFKSKGEWAVVEYFLCRFTRSIPTTEGRSVSWLPYREANDAIVHDDAKSILRSAMKEVQLSHIN